MIGDNAFPLKSDLMKPYPGKNIRARESVYKYGLSRARQCIQNSFGILSCNLENLVSQIFVEIEFDPYLKLLSFSFY